MDAKIKYTLSQPGFVESICREVSNGADLIDQCRKNNISYFDFRNFCESSPTHKQMLNAAISARDEFFVESIINEIKNIGLVNIKNMYDASGNLLSVAEMSDQVAAAIENIDTTIDKDGNTTQRIKLTNKLKALELLGKQLKMFVDRSEVKTQITLEELINASMQDDNEKEKTETTS